MPRPGRPRPKSSRHRRRDDEERRAVSRDDRGAGRDPEEEVRAEPVRGAALERVVIRCGGELRQLLAPALADLKAASRADALEFVAATRRSRRRDVLPQARRRPRSEAHEDRAVSAARSRALPRDRAARPRRGSRLGGRDDRGGHSVRAARPGHHPRQVVLRDRRARGRRRGLLAARSRVRVRAQAHGRRPMRARRHRRGSSAARRRRC